MQLSPSSLHFFVFDMKHYFIQHTTGGAESLKFGSIVILRILLETIQQKVVIEQEKLYTREQHDRPS